jgi:hypothetical protein
LLSPIVLCSFGGKCALFGRAFALSALNSVLLICLSYFFNKREGDTHNDAGTARRFFACLRRIAGLLSGCARTPLWIASGGLLPTWFVTTYCSDANLDSVNVQE